MSRQTYRIIYAGLGLALLAVIAFGVAFSGNSDESAGRPPVLEDVSPAVGSQVSRLEPVEVDLPIGYEVELWVDFRGNDDGSPNWFRVPAEQIVFVEGTGVFSWQPAPQRVFEEWPPGTQRVRADWDTVTGLPDPGSYEWSFRVSG